ncbi:MAG: hypothetical protein JSW10_04065 [Pseudomonadota bacterium]|nr:MAG: hypothetical protein JSW10_04065 [Pseudomonadota bacterium]
MDREQMQQLSCADLARLLVERRHQGREWHALREECRRRCARWNSVANFSAATMLACFVLVLLVTVR